MKNHLDDLKNELAEHRLVVVAGAGVAKATVPRAQCELAGWPGLLESGVDAIEGCPGVSVSPETAKRLREQARSADLDEVIGVAQAIERKLGAPSGGEFQRWLRSSVGSLEVHDRAVIDAILALGCPIITTNFDSLLEKASGFGSVTWKRPNLVQRVLRGDERRIVHLHGYWEEPESVVLGWRSYTAVTGDEHAEIVQRSLALNKTLLFVGFGAGLTDPNFGPLFDWMARVFAGSEVRHYRLCLASEEEQLRREHPSDQRLVVLPYGNVHSDLAPFLRRLAPSSGALAGRVARPAPSEPWMAEPALVPLLLAGSFDEANAADQEVVGRLAGRAYADVRDTLGRWPEAFLRKGTTVSFARPDEGFRRLGRLLTPSQVEGFREQAVAVLGEVHRRFDLPEEERETAAWRGFSLRHSEALRRGLAESVAMLATRLGPEVAIGSRPEDVATRVVAELLREASWQRWASVSALLPTLAEAAPDVFLGAVEDDLRSPRPQVPELLKDEPGFFGESHRSHLLWALEILGWAPEYLPRVAHLLARLVPHDPGSQYANGPRASLVNLFRAWNPQTLAEPKVRQLLLESIGRRYGELGFALLLDLVPGAHEFQVPAARPQFRPWVRPEEREVKGEEFRADLRVIFRLLTSMAKEQPSRWVALLARLDDLPPGIRASVMDGTRAAVEAGALPECETLREQLEDLLHRHRTYADQKWALPVETVQELQRLLDLLPPLTGHHRYARLFASPMPHLPEGEHPDAEAALTSLHRKRTEAMEQLLAEGGIEEVAELARASPYPRLVGGALGASERGPEPDAVLPWAGADDPRLRSAATAYLTSAHGRHGDDWLAGVLASPVFHSLPPRARGEVLSTLPFGPRIWKRIEAEGPEATAAYWRSVFPHPAPPDEELPSAVSALLAADRAGDAVRLLAGSKGAVAPGVAVPALLQLARSEPKADVAHWVDKLVGKLEREHTLPLDQLARLDFQLIGVAGHRPRALFRWLATSGQAFAELVRMLYRRSDGHADPEEVPEDERAVRVRVAFRLLHEFQTVPGTGEPDFEAFLRAWVLEARADLRACGRLEAGDVEIGKLLAHAPPDDRDQHFPHRAVRALLEELDSPQLEQGFSIGVLNGRGPTWRSLDEGGAQERELARSYRETAGFLGAECPRTATALRRAADRLESEARRQDDERISAAADVDVDDIIDRARRGDP